MVILKCLRMNLNFIVSQLDLSQNEAIEVMQKYLSLFEQESSDFLYHFMENSLLDWYGRSVRGANRIHEYLRFVAFLSFPYFISQ